jgi:hypothetical protein
VVLFSRPFLATFILGLGLFCCLLPLGLCLIAIHYISEISQIYSDPAHVCMGHSLFRAQKLFDPANLLLSEFTDLNFTHFNSQKLSSLND